MKFTNSLSYPVVGKSFSYKNISPHYKTEVYYISYRILDLISQHLLKLPFVYCCWSVTIQCFLDIKTVATQRTWKHWKFKHWTHNILKKKKYIKWSFFVQCLFLGYISSGFMISTGSYCCLTSIPGMSQSSHQPCCCQFLNSFLALPCKLDDISFGLWSGAFILFSVPFVPRLFPV